MTLSDRQELAARALEIAQVIIVVLDVDGRVKLINQRGSDVLGYAESELLGKSWFDTCIEESVRDELFGVFCELLGGDALDPHRYDNQIVNRSGELRTIEWSNALIRDEDGEVVGTLSSGIDVTESRRATALLERSEHKYRRLMATANDAIFLANAEGTLIDANEAAVHLVGRSREELIGTSQTTLHPPGSADHYRAMFERHLRDGKTRELELLVQHSAGHTIPVAISSSVTEIDGQMVNQGIFRDLREQRHAELKLLQAAAVFDSTNAGIAITDPEGNIIAVNRAFSAITGYQENEVLGKNPRILQSGRQDREFYASMWRTITTTGRWEGEFWNRRKNGEIYPQIASISSVVGANGELSNYVSVFTDMSRLHESEALLEHVSHHDPLTDLPNRLLFTALLDHAIQCSHRDRSQVGLVIFDLDDFRKVVDTLGLQIGDQILVEVGVRLAEVCTEHCTLARLGSDMFAISVESVRSLQEIAALTERALEATRRPHLIGKGRTVVTASAGIALSSPLGEDSGTLMRNADSAVHQAKQSGPGHFRFYNEEMTLRALERLTLESRLREALERDELELRYQPLVRVDDGLIVGCEALVRWRHPERGLLSPGLFIPIAEDAGLIEDIGEWVLDKACGDLADWRRQGLRPMRVSVNVSPLQLGAGLIGSVESALSKSGLDPNLLELEITESSIAPRDVQIVPVLERIASLGVSLAIDDFGTGYSSLSQLSRLPVDRLKIDRSFLAASTSGRNEENLVRAIVSLGNSLDLYVLGEGVETEAQRSLLYGAGCYEMQGFLISPPVEAARFLELVDADRRLPAPSY